MAAFVQQARDAGAMGYLPKSASLATLTRAVQMVIDGNAVFPARTPVERVPSDLEIRIVTLAAAGFTSNEIGARVDLTAKAVERHLARLYSRYDARGRSHLAIIALEKGWISRANVEEASKSVPRLHPDGTA